MFVMPEHLSVLLSLLFDFVYIYIYVVVCALFEHGFICKQLYWI